MEIAASAPSHLQTSAAVLRRAERAAQEFEALVVAQMLAPLLNSVETPAPFGGGEGEKAFTSLLHEEFARSMAAHGGFGIAEQVKAELIKLQAAQSTSRTSPGSEP
ncbi:MAG: rod-binding protein [Parvularculaceae bacterium]